MLPVHPLDFSTSSAPSTGFFSCQGCSGDGMRYDELSEQDRRDLEAARERRQRATEERARLSAEAAAREDARDPARWAGAVGLILGALLGLVLFWLGVRGPSWPIPLVPDDWVSNVVLIGGLGLAGGLSALGAAWWAYIRGRVDASTRR